MSCSWIASIAQTLAHAFLGDFFGKTENEVMVSAYRITDKRPQETFLMVPHCVKCTK